MYWHRHPEPDKFPMPFFAAAAIALDNQRFGSLPKSLHNSSLALSSVAILDFESCLPARLM
jgi:hypothetical protein